ncbi:MAG: hypothetical protein KTV77_02585 [Wolbachia endosymbiont of Fragariocoptes setiger]|nr:hypothetical protein [Wolbachia endosymbiont of Fragariocoptes setiger]
MYRLLILLLFSASSFASVSDIKFRGKHKDWSTYTAIDNGEKICYIISYPNKKSDNNRNSYVSVSYINNKADEVMVNSTFPYEKEEPVILNIDNKTKYKLPIIERSSAWTENIKVDQDLILKMKKGLSMTISGKTKSTIVNDTYSLLGFHNAYNEMHNLCR